MAALRLVDLSIGSKEAYRIPEASTNRFTTRASLPLSGSVASSTLDEEAFRSLIVRVFMSPSFLLHISTAEPVPLATGSEQKITPLDNWALASRVSYFLWSSTPDEELRQLANAGTLHQPNGSPTARYDFAPLPPPEEPSPDADQIARLYAETQDAFALNNLPLLPLGWGSVQGAASGRGGDVEGPAPGWGSGGGGRAASNNWAVSPARTANGHALLSGDPHLSLTLPSIWYEVHMSVPGEMDVHGVTIPGYPGVIIGFTRDIAWSFTNTGADVVDFYREALDDEAAPTRYRLDGEWRPLERRIEEYRDQGGEILAADTVYYTHRGPVRRTEEGVWSMRWAALDQPLNTEMFTDALAATSVEEWLDAVAAYAGPAQNMIVADRSGNIAIRSTGFDGLILQQAAIFSGVGFRGCPS